MNKKCSTFSTNIETHDCNERKKFIPFFRLAQPNIREFWHTVSFSIR